jgi:predicted nucleic acid-binding protein
MAFKSLKNDQLLSNAIVVDNSVMMRWLFKDGSESDQHYAQTVLRHIDVDKPHVIAPSIWVYEAAFVVNYYAKKDIVSYETSMNHLNSLFDVCTVIRGEETPAMLFDMSHTHNLSAYDASYVMLALQQDCPIATLDKAIIAVSGQLNLKIFSHSPP